MEGLKSDGYRPAPDDLRDEAETSFKSAMRHLVSGVSIVTVASGGESGGLTATSVSSFSTDPPSLIVCVKQNASCMPLLRRADRFGVSILGGTHQAIADRFAGRDGSTGAARFAGADWTAEAGRPPVLIGALASFECALDEIIDRYSHAIIIGRVLKTRSHPADDALLYWRGAYGLVGRKA